MLEAPKVVISGKNSAILESSNGHALTCSICSDVADGAHFGADSCRACAAFYRSRIFKILIRIISHFWVVPNSKNLIANIQLPN
jgi:hypothetical protein